MVRWQVSVILVIAVASASARSAHAESELDIPGLDSTELRGDAMVWEDASFYPQPWETGTPLRFVGLTRRGEEVGRVVAIRIVDASRRAFIEVELAGQAHCSWRKLVGDPRVGGLRWFVPRRDLAPVLIKPFAIQNSDGTRLRLSPGVPVVPTSQGDYWVAIRDERIRLAIPHSSVGYTFKPAKPIAEAVTGKLARLDRNATIHLGELAITLRTPWMVPLPTDRATDNKLIAMNSRCIELVGSVAANMVKPSTEQVRPPVTPPVAVTPNTGWRIAPGVPLSTPEGREVAVAAMTVMVQAPTGDIACFDARMMLSREDVSYYTGARTLRLCAPSSLVER